MEDLATITGRIIPALLVTQLKALIKSLNENVQPHPQLKLGGNKSELIHRLVEFITHYHQIGDQVVIRQIRHCVLAFKQGEVSTIATPSLHLNPLGNAYRMSSGPNIMNTLKPTSGQPTSHLSHSQQLLQQQHQQQLHQQQQHQQQHHHQQPHHHQHYGGSSSLSSQVRQVFKSSPFYKDIQTLGVPRPCPEAKDRTLSTGLNFTITPMLSMQLKKDPEYQLMVFCGWADGPPNTPILMEFPHACEIKVNGRILEANLRGMKNKPGTVSPANITKLCRIEATEYNKVEFVYANSTKRYYASVHLVKKTSVETIIGEIERGKFLSKEQMLRMIEDRNKDDDIMATSSTLSLKCPLGFQRIKIPCRSSYCHHLQCFDAYTFFNLNEQTPTWTCPVCSRIMHSWEEIVVDGYFKDILNSTPQSLEAVTVQADGSWEIPSAAGATQAVIPSPKKKAPATSDVYVLEDDSDDEDNRTQATEQQAAPTPTKPAAPVIEIIDLISDSEDEGEAPAPVDYDGDASMQDAANSLHNLGQSTTGVSHSVKAEVIDKPPSPHVNRLASILDTQSVTSAHASPTASSEASPVISNRMVQTEPIPVGPLSPTSRMPPAVWATTEESFMNDHLRPRRKRQYEDTVDSETINHLSQDARHRIAIRSAGSSDRGSSSNIPSPDGVRPSTSSPTPVPSYHDRIGNGRHSEGDEASFWSRNNHWEHGLGGSNSTGFYNNSSSIATSTAGTSYGYPHSHGRPQHTGISQGGLHRSSRSETMSPPVHHGYGSASPNRSHPPHHRSTHSPAADYYSSASSRPPSSGSIQVVTMPVRSNSMSVGKSTTTSSPFLGANSGWLSEGHTNGNHNNGGDRTHGWAPDSTLGLYSGSSGHAHQSSSHSSRRPSGEEVRTGTRPSPGLPTSPGHTASSTSNYPHHPVSTSLSPVHYQQHSQSHSHSHSHSHPHSSHSHSQSQHIPSHSQPRYPSPYSQHQRHRSNEEESTFDQRRDGSRDGSYTSLGARLHRSAGSNGDEAHYSQGQYHPSQGNRHVHQQQQQHQPLHSQQQNHVYNQNHNGPKSSLTGYGYGQESIGGHYPPGSGGSTGGEGYQGESHEYSRRRSQDRRGSDHGSSYANHSNDKEDDAPIFYQGVRGARAR